MSIFHIGVTRIGGAATTQELNPESNAVPAGYYASTTLSAVDVDLAEQNILQGATIFGKAGALVTTGTQFTMPATGQTIQYHANDNSAYVPATSLRSFTDNGNNTLTDNGTGLMWVKDTDAAGVGGTYTWANAVIACNDLVYAGHDDWRLPNIKELQTLVGYQSASPVYASPLFAGGVGDVQSSTRWGSYIYVIKFYHEFWPWRTGGVRAQSDLGYFIRPCRSVT